MRPRNVFHQINSTNCLHRLSATNIASDEGKNMRFDVWKDIVAVLSKVDERVPGIVGSRSRAMRRVDRN